MFLKCIKLRYDKRCSLHVRGDVREMHKIQIQSDKCLINNKYKKMKKILETSAADVETAKKLKGKAQVNNNLKRKGGYMKNKYNDKTVFFIKMLFVNIALWMSFYIIMALMQINPELVVELLSNIAESAGFVEVVRLFRR